MNIYMLSLKIPYPKILPYPGGVTCHINDQVHCLLYTSIIQIKKYLYNSSQSIYPFL